MELDLRHNRLKTLPAEIEKLRDLAYLYLDGNLLSAREKTRILNTWEKSGSFKLIDKIFNLLLGKVVFLEKIVHFLIVSQFL